MSSLCDEIVLLSAQIPHMVQQRMSGETLPHLGGAVPSFELFMITWQTLSVTCPRLKGWIDEGLKWAQKYYNRMDGNITYILAMCKQHQYSMQIY